jgi:Tfp pilus assembly PilM family ATPase
MALFNPLASIFGLDIGDRSFKLVQLAREKKGGLYRVKAWSEIDVPEGIMSKGEILEMDKAAAIINELISKTGGRVHGRAVVACLPEARTFIKVIRVPADTNEDGLKKAVIKEIEQNIPLPSDEIYFDWQAMMRGVPTETPAKPEEPKKEGEPAASPAPAAPAKDLDVLVGAAPKSLVDSYTTLLDRAGLAPVALEIEAMAITRALTTEADAKAEEALGILDIGATRSSLAIFDDGILQMTISIPVSGNEITKTIADALQLKWDEAELLKRECGLDANRCEDKMWNILLPLLDDMTEKIRNALRFYRIGFPDGKKIEKLYLCGGGAGFREIDNVLSRKLTIKVRRGDALSNVSKKLPSAFPKDDALTFTTAIGLAMRASDEATSRRSSLQVK